MTPAPHHGSEVSSEGAAGADQGLRADLALITSWIAPCSRVLDVGCGDGALLADLTAHKAVRGRGIELSQAGVNACVVRGLCVVQGDANRDLEDFPTQAFDYAVLSRTLHMTKSPRAVLDHLLRISRQAVVSLPNYGHIRVRTRMISGQVTSPLASEFKEQDWWESDAIRPCSLRDFTRLARTVGATIVRQVGLDALGRPNRGIRRVFPNLLAHWGLFVLTRADSTPAKAEPAAEMSAQQ